MRTLALLCLLAAAAFPQQQPIRGVLLERDDAVDGEFSLRAPDYHVLRFRFDAKTAVERQGQGIAVPGLHPGDQVEVVSEAAGDAPLPYARAVQVTLSVPAFGKTSASPVRPRPYNLQDERLASKGDLVFSGVILRLEGARLLLRTRTAGEQIIVLRQDTRYLENGALVMQSSLKPTMRVFVRGARNLYGDVEGYQVMWGDILEVR